MEGHNLLHELDVLHQAHEIIGEQLNRRDRANSSGIERRRMHVAAFHQAEHFAGHAAHLKRLAIERAGEGIQGAHDVRDGVEAVQICARGGRFLRFGEDRGIGFLDHLLAEIHAHEVVLEDVVVEHVLGGLAEIDDPLTESGRAHTKGHVLRVGGTSGVVVATDSADAAGDEMRVARILTLHENAVAAENRRGAVTFRDLAVFKVNLGKNPEAANDAGDRIPVHLHQFPRTSRGTFRRCSSCSHDSRSFSG